jgi:alpha-D-ribose 1-methylphosphonate 5-triphosphate diphosphatase
VSTTTLRAAARPWPLGDPPADYVLGGVDAVLPDRVVPDARVVVRGGRIAEVGSRPAGARPDVDGGGALCLPGLVDVHTDVLSRETYPRPGAGMPVHLAARAATDRLAAAGVTTAFHGVPFGDRSPVGTPAPVPGAPALLHALREPPVPLPGARVLHRVDIRCPAGVAELAAALAAEPAGAPPALVSHEDHTPGIGQYADPRTMERWLVENAAMPTAAATAHVAAWREERELRAGVAAETLSWLGGLARAGRVRLMGHDPETVAEVEALAGRGGTVAEFPTTLAAARAARERGLLVVAGAPNAVRGGSHAGNVSARELVAHGLVDALASDYLPSSLLAAVHVLVEAGVTGLPRAVALVTAGPAAAAGLADRGVLAVGARADLVLADVTVVPQVRAVLRAHVAG